MYSVEDRVVNHLSAGLVRRKFCFIGFNDNEATRLACQFAESKCLSRAVNSLDMAADLIDCYDLLIVNADSLVEEPLNGIGTLRKIQKPVIFIGSSEESARAVSGMKPDRDRFIERPWQFADILMLSHSLIFRADEKQLGAQAPEARILIADDDPKITSLLRAVFRNLHMQCQIARTGREALSTIRTSLPDLVYLDINMAAMSGFDVLSAVRQDPGTAPMLVALLTERRDERDILRASELNADSYVMKPFSTLELSSRTKKLLRRDLS
jgi:CheY-like chemotaxis protein